MDHIIYLDNHATTPCDPRVIESMLPYFGREYGNPSSTQYGLGRHAAEAVQLARGQVARALGGAPGEVVFTAGATEAINLALKGLADAAPPDRDQVVISAIEHHAVLETAEALARRGIEVVTAPVGQGGRIDLEALGRLVTERTLAVAIMAANNEVGTLQPVEAIGALCAEAGAAYLCDVAQALGKIPLALPNMNVDLAAMSAHKLYGPKGVGALWIRRGGRGDRLRPQVHGASHERGLRAGTLNVPGIVGFGQACAIATAEMPEESARAAQLRDRLFDRLREECADIRLNGDREHRLAQNLHVALPGIEARELLSALSGVAISAGSACTTDEDKPSHVLRAMGCGDNVLYSSIRCGIGRWTTREEIETAADLILAVVQQLRA